MAPVGGSEFMYQYLSKSRIPIEVQYESLGTFHEIHERYQIRKGRMGEILYIYIQTSVGWTHFKREIEESIQGVSYFELRELS